MQHGLFVHGVVRVFSLCVHVCMCVYKYVNKHVCIHGFSLDVPRCVLHTQESTTVANVKNVPLTFCSVYTTS